jgi:drug efflux transport system permease protein
MNQQGCRRLRALLIKEFYQIIKDPSTILISILLPLILMTIYGFGVSLDIDHLRIGLVLEDTSPDAQSFATALTNSRFFDVTTVRDRRELDYALKKGKIRGIVVVPSYFSTFRQLQERAAPIQVLSDGSEPNTASFVQNYVSAAWQLWLQQEAISRKLEGLALVHIEPRFWYNEELLSRNFLVPGSLAIIMTLVGTLLTALVIAREWERGTMESQMATPVTITELLLGKLIPYYLLGMGSMIMCVLYSRLVYNIPLRGSILTLVFVSSIFLFAALGLGLLISTLARNQVVAAQTSLVVGFMPAFMLSGFIFEITSMPPIIQFITYLLPARYFVTCLQTIFLVGDIWELFFYDIIIMGAIGFVFYFLTSKTTVKRLD